MEGPSLVILKELLKPFKGKTIRNALGSTTKIDLAALQGRRITGFRSWGKHFLITFTNFTIRIHFLMFGSYRVNEEKAASPRLHLQFDEGFLNFYACSIVRIDEHLDDVYDWSVDVMSDSWDSKKARRKLKKLKENNVSDVLLNQDIFAGVGNIIKNEVLFRIRVHPETLVENLQPRKLTALIEEARNYSFDFYKWKKIYQLKKHWLIYTKKKCPACRGPVTKRHTGKNPRRSFFCGNCQPLFVRKLNP